MLAGVGDIAAYYTSYGPGPGCNSLTDGNDDEHVDEDHLGGDCDTNDQEPVNSEAVRVFFNLSSWPSNDETVGVFLAFNTFLGVRMRTPI